MARSPNPPASRPRTQVRTVVRSAGGGTKDVRPDAQFAPRALNVRKNWNSTLAQSEAMHTLMEQALRGFKNEACAFVTPEGRSLHVRPMIAADCVSLPQTALICHQYLRLRDGDLAIVNDPAAGGTMLSHLTLVTGVRFDPLTDRGETDLLIACRLQFDPHWGKNAKLDEEGVRIPPTPLATAGDINRELLAAIASHPLAPPGLAMAIENASAQLRDCARLLKAFGRDPGCEFRQAHFKRYLADSSLAFAQQIARLPLGTSVVSSEIEPSGETLKLQLEMTENTLRFDFAGTDDSQIVALNELATFGACVAAILSALGEPIAINSGVLDHFQVSTPAKTLLSAKGNQGTFRGMTEGVASVGILVRRALAKLNGDFQLSEAATSEGYLEVSFASGPRVVLRASPGGPATREREGLNAFALFGESLNPSGLSVEHLESFAPLRMTARGLRTGSGGHGQNRGGRGELCAFVVNEDANLKWSVGSFGFAQDGIDLGRKGSPGALEIVRTNGTTETLDLVSSPAKSEAKLNRGDEVRFTTPAAGGHGSVNAE